MTGLPHALRGLRSTVAMVLALLVLGCAGAGEPQQEEDHAPAASVALATFAGGCFWCMEPPYDRIDGVLSTTAGYAGGPERNPTYEQVAGGRTGHAEVVQVAYDPQRVSYAELLRVYWRNIDPFAVDRQFCDRGRAYRTVIYVHDAQQAAAAEASLAEVAARFDQPIATRIEPVGDTFHAAEEYHQDYYLKNPLRYRYYRASCGRDRRLGEIWGDEAGG
ncbi:peptide-methionine (S)-S-oxide reductase MsrA [Alkalisalibacterium limincola]|nr:peptide-methionine (S)-S-oxide reductase MsrA [Alkalisalibacterium limincola]